MDLALAKLLQNYNPYALAGSEMEDATPFATDAEGVGLIQLLGAGCLIAVVLTHISEAFHWFPWMHWGRPNRVGHYIDFWSAAIGLTLFPLGYLLDALTKPRV